MLFSKNVLTSRVKQLDFYFKARFCQSDVKLSCLFIKIALSSDFNDRTVSFVAIVLYHFPSYKRHFTM